MKICIIFPTYPPNYQIDGIGDYTRVLVRELRDKGQDVHVIASGLYAGKDEKVIRIGGGKWGLSELIKVFNRIRSEKFNVVHMQYTPVTYGFGPMFKLLPLLVRISAQKILFVTTFHTLTGGRWISKINAFILLMFSHKIISTHEELTELIGKWCGIFRAKVEQVPIGANIMPENTAGVNVEKLRSDFKHKQGISENSVMMINFGFSNPWKGLETLLMALKNLARKGRYHLILQGAVRDEDVEYRNKLRGTIRLYGLEKEVIWVESLSEKNVSGMLRMADFCVLPFTDGVSVRRGSLIAAIAHGMPVISTFPRVGIPYLKNEENILLVEREDPKQLAEAIERMAKHGDLREKLSTNIIKLRGMFNWDKIADDTLEVYGG